MSGIDNLLQVMRDLRHPENGCPWDIRQTSASIAPYTLDETHELLDAIERGDTDNLKEELGDLLFNIVFHARIAEEKRQFDFDAVAQGIADKMRNRHPHVFDDDYRDNPDDQRLAEQWQALKAREKAGRDAAPAPADGESNSPLYRARELQKHAARYGFDWADLGPVFDKLEEELAELREACESGDRDAITGELGDLMFVCVNVARHARVNAEMALRETNRKFMRRFEYVQQRMRDAGVAMDRTELARMEDYWQQAKKVVG